MNNLEIFGIPYFKKGSGIHIKKENRGKFTDYCNGKVTNECILRGKNSSNPKIRKRATFAANSRKWSRKHLIGGPIEYQGPTYSEVQELWKKEDPESYNVALMNMAMKRGGTNEIVHYIDVDGNFRSIPRVIGMSGTDPIARDVVLGVAMSKPLQYIGGKVLNFINPKLPKSVNLITENNVSNASRVTSNLSRSTEHPLTLFESRIRTRYGNTTDDLLNKVRNPKVVKTKEDLLAIAKEFYRNIYKDKKLSEELLEAIASEMLLKHPKAFEHYFRTTYLPNPNIITTGGFQGLIKGTNPSPEQLEKIKNIFSSGTNWWDAITHEGAHLFRWNKPTNIPKPEGFDFSKLHPKVKQYFTNGASNDNPMYDELLARGTLVKNWLGIKDNTPITGQQLKELAQGAYRKSGAIDNNMTEFFSGITDYDKFAKWLSTYALGTTPLILNYDK